MKRDSPATQSAGHDYINFLATLDEHKVPAPIFERAQASLIDSVGCGLFGATQTWAQMMADNTLAESATGRCTLLGRSEMLAPAPAALVNGTAMHGFELDDLISE